MNYANQTSAANLMSDYSSNQQAQFSSNLNWYTYTYVEPKTVDEVLATYRDLPGAAPTALRLLIAEVERLRALQPKPPALYHWLGADAERHEQA